MEKAKLSVSTNSEEIVVGDDNFVINAKELIEELENIGDYEGIREIKEDLDKLKN